MRRVKLRLRNKEALRRMSVFGAVGIAAILLALASENLHWSSTTVLIVGAGIAFTFGLFGPPIIFGEPGLWTLLRERHRKTANAANEDKD